MSLSAIRVFPKTPGKLAMIETVPPSLTDYVVPCSQQTVVKGNAGHFMVQEIKVAACTIYYVNVLLTEDESFRVTSKNPLLLLQFFMDNVFFVTANGSEKMIFPEGRYNLTYVPGLDHEFTFLKGRVYTCVMIDFPLPTYSKLARIYPDMGDFLKEVQTQKLTFLYPGHPVITKEMDANIKMILTCNFNEAIKTDYLKGKAMEILLEVLECEAVYPTAPLALTKKEIEQVSKVRDELDKNFNQSLTLEILARQVGSYDPRKLSSGFHYLFRIPLIEYRIEKRMERAEYLLLHTDESIDSIADAVGYTGGNTFAKEFVKHYELTPAKYREEKRKTNR